MTLMEQAQKNIVTKEVEEVAKYEQVSTDFVTIFFCACSIKVITIPFQKIYFKITNY